MKIKHNLLRLQMPGGVATWRFLFQRSDPIIAQHRKALWFVPPGKNPFKYKIFAFFQQVAWYFFFAWKAMFKILRKKDRWPSKDQRIKTSDLFYLTFVLSTPPQNYFSLQLYKVPKAEWLNFIFSQESSKWLESKSTEVSEECRKYLNSKFYFSKKSSKAGIPTIPSIAFYKQYRHLKASDIFQKKSLFFKPDTANQSRGCYTLSYNEIKDNYYFIKEKETIGEDDPKKILATLNSELSIFDYVVQPLIKNHPEISHLCGDDRLTTIRIITYSSNSSIQPLFAIFEIPNLEDRRFYKLISIDIQSGILANKYIGQDRMKMNNENESLIKNLSGQTIPQWSSVLELTQKSHALCPGICMIGWDVAISSIGVILVEGNIGWDTKFHQLDGRALALFMEKLENDVV